MFENINILHIVLDEKFTDFAYKWFESVAPSCNTFLVPSRNTKMKYIKVTPIKIINILSFKNPFFMKSLEKYDFIVLHSLSKFNVELVAHASPSLKFVWIGMGYDYYDIIYENSDLLYQDQTKNLIKKLKCNKKWSKAYLNQLFQSILWRNDKKKEIIRKIHFFAPVIESEYKMVASNFRSNFPDYIGWNYGSTTNIIKETIKYSTITGNNILVGNSSSPENNHLEVFDFLKNQKLNGVKIICPLSYGDFKYANILKDIGKNYFGDSFLSIDKFMPSDNYFNLLSCCSNVIMNHHRQQAIGNVSVMLHIGARIFLNEVNPLHSFYKEKGAIIFTIEDLYQNPDLLYIKMSEADIKINQQIIELMVDEKNIIGKTEKLIKKVISLDYDH